MLWDFEDILTGGWSTQRLGDATEVNNDGLDAIPFAFYF